MNTSFDYWYNRLVISEQFQGSFRAVSEQIQSSSPLEIGLRCQERAKWQTILRFQRSSRAVRTPSRKRLFFLFLHRIIIKNERLQQSLPRLNILEPRTFFGGRRGGGRSLVTCSVARPYAVVVATQQVTQLITSAFVRFDETHQLKRREVR